ncbi:hypothetical protein GUJ93_ZPchr0004g39928 [Zizania palustris]|uniref:Uncharacterized protein n=1 Tax=Zizania palustris TaxID=103762 RepID=A0A8J5RZ29_ZIZPA|nr:hypothetical protein GUJ93_ZPchr0004g39928 [Zizania palustris]
MQHCSASSSDLTSAAARDESEGDEGKLMHELHAEVVEGEGPLLRSGPRWPRRPRRGTTTGRSRALGSSGGGWRGGVRCSSPAQEFATLASVFRRRLVVGASTAAAAAVGANFGGVTSFLLGLSPAGPAASPSRHTANSHRFGESTEGWWIWGSRS